MSWWAIGLSVYFGPGILLVACLIVFGICNGEWDDMPTPKTIHHYLFAIIVWPLLAHFIYVNEFKPHLQLKTGVSALSRRKR